MTVCSRGFKAHAVAAAFMMDNVGVPTKLLWHTKNVTTRVLALIGAQLVVHHTDTVWVFNAIWDTDGEVVQHG